MYIDSHAHFDMCLEDRSLTEKSMLIHLNNNNVKYAVQVSTEAETFEWSYNFAKNNTGIFFTLGIHPSSMAAETDINLLSDTIQKVIDSGDRDILFGIGETGLDYYRMHQPRNIQIHSFESQLDIADKYKLPVIIHSRHAKDETINILKQKKPGAGVIHCFEGNSKAAKEFLDLGFFISFAGNLTYNKAADLHDAASYVPLDRVLLETDAPYLTPVPLRGKKNMPEYVIYTYQFFAKLRNEDLTKIEDRIYSNFCDYSAIL